MHSCIPQPELAPENSPTHQCLSDSAVLNLRACSSSMGRAKSYTQNPRLQRTTPQWNGLQAEQLLAWAATQHHQGRVVAVVGSSQPGAHQAAWGWLSVISHWARQEQRPQAAGPSPSKLDVEGKVFVHLAQQLHTKGLHHLLDALQQLSHLRRLYATFPGPSLETTLQVARGCPWALKTGCSPHATGLWGHPGQRDLDQHPQPRQLA